MDVLQSPSALVGSPRPGDAPGTVMPKRKIKILLDDSRHTKSRSSMVASGRRKSRTKSRYMATLEPGAGGMPVGGNLRMSKQSKDDLGLDSRVDFMDLDAQVKYY